MNHCCLSCQEVLDSGKPHQELLLLSEVSESKIYKCERCKTYMHFVLGVWELFMASSPPQTQKTTKNSALDTPNYRSA